MFVNDLQGFLGLKDCFPQLRVVERLEGRLHRFPFDLSNLLVGRLLLRGKIEFLDGPLRVRVGVDGIEQLAAQGGEVFAVGVLGNLRLLPLVNLPGRAG